MGHQIIEQPGGTGFCVYSTVVDGFVAVNVSEEDLIAWYVEQAAEKEEKRVKELIEKIQKGEKPYHQFTMSYEEACHMNDMNYPDE